MPPQSAPGLQREHIPREAQRADEKADEFFGGVPFAHIFKRVHGVEKEFLVDDALEEQRVAHLAHRAGGVKFFDILAEGVKSVGIGGGNDGAALALFREHVFGETKGCAANFSRAPAFFTPFAAAVTLPFCSVKSVSILSLSL